MYRAAAFFQIVLVLLLVIDRKESSTSPLT